MRCHLRHKQRAQIALIAPVAIIALIGVLGLVIDVGIFRLIDSELENAADAAALAASWYDPVCPGDPAFPANFDPRCGTGNPLGNGNAPGKAYLVADDFAKRNLGFATVLCGSRPVVERALIHPLQSPSAPGVTVIVYCDAGYFAGRVQGLGSTRIIRWGTAAIGERYDSTDSSGTVRRNMGDYQGPPSPRPFLLARLVPL